MFPPPPCDLSWHRGPLQRKARLGSTGQCCHPSHSLCGKVLRPFPKLVKYLPYIVTPHFPGGVMGKLVAAKASPWQAEWALTADAFVAEGGKRKFQRPLFFFLSADMSTGRRYWYVDLLKQEMVSSSGAPLGAKWGVRTLSRRLYEQLLQFYAELDKRSGFKGRARRQDLKCCLTECLCGPLSHSRTHANMLAPETNSLAAVCANIAVKKARML